jgi:ABC-type lipoprotein release transport system permease subunit
VGRVLLVFRLAVRNVRRRPAEAALLVLAIMAATTMLTLGLALRGVTDDPYERTRETTAGPDVVATVSPDLVPTSDRVVVDDQGTRRPADAAVIPADVDGLEALTEATGVIGHSGPYPATVADFEANGVTTEVWAEGRGPDRGLVDQPGLTQGSWVEDGGVVVEAAFANALDVDAGDQVTLNGRSFRVVGVAVTAAASYTDVCFGPACGFFIPPDRRDELSDRPPPEAPAAAGPIDVEAFPFPPDDAGLVWLTEADIRGVAGEQDFLSYVVNLKLADPEDAPAFIDAHSPSSWVSPFLASWLDIRDTYGEFVRGARQALVTFGSLLTLLAMASVAVLVGGRMADQTRRVGLLKAVGGTPGLVAVVLLAEYMALALLAAAAGLAVGWLAAPLLSDPGAGLLGSAGTPSLTMSTVGVVTAVALGVAVLATFVSAVRAARTSTVDALADSARRPRRTRWLIALSTRLPVPLLLGLRVIARRPRRVLLGIASIAVTVSGIVAVLAGRSAMAADWDGPSSLDPQAERANQVLLVITVTLVALAAINAIVITWAAALDARHASALARALGATPREVSAGLSAAQVLPAFAGAILGVAGGLALWTAIGDDETNPTYWQLLGVVAGTGLVVAVLTIIPTRLAARRPVTETLRAELT